MYESKLAPIIVFCYNRQFHLEQLIESLKNNSLAESSSLFIFSDGYRKEDDREAVLEVRRYLSTITGFKEIHIEERQLNMGLGNNVIEGVSYVLEKFDKVIVLEDDLLVSSDFLDFMNRALDFYTSDPRIYSISGFNFKFKLPKNYKEQVYLLPRICSLGWGTWRDRWNSVNWNMEYFPSFIEDVRQRKKFEIGGENLTLILLKQYLGYYKSWAIRWDYNRFLNNAYCLYPANPKVINKGNDGSGTNDSVFIKQNTRLSNIRVGLKENIEVNEELVNAASGVFRLSIIKKIYFKYLLLKYYLKNIV